VFTEIEVIHEVTGRNVSEGAIRRSIELSATKYCPVSAMISAGATVVHHRYRIHSTGERPYEAEGEVISTGPYAPLDILADQS
jgi:putative redox protein